jgi:hypothetical protein
MNEKLERMWKKVTTTYFKALSQHSSGGAEENHEPLYRTRF